jgi:hypothetical protein
MATDTRSFRRAGRFLVSVLAGVFDDLNNMSQLQLLLAFMACIATVLSLGRLLAPRARAVAGTGALASTLGFIGCSSSWPNAVMLTTLAVVGLGLFSAAVWLTTRLIGLEPRGRHAALRADSTLPPDAAGAGGETRHTHRPEHIAST